MPKKPLDINKPRGPITAYALFVRTCRDELRRKHPQLTVDYNIIVKKCSERWKHMNDNEKKRFNDTADIQRKKYKEDLATYEQEQLIKQQQQQQQQQQSILFQTSSSSSSSTSLSNQYHIEPQIQQTILDLPKKTIKRREKKPKDPHAPKKPLSAYFLFCADERPKVHHSQTGMSVSDVARELGIRWKQVSAELKIKYEQAASEKKHVYQTEMALYKHQTSTSSSPPETPQTPHDYQTTFIQQSSQIQFDNNNINENQMEFDNQMKMMIN